MDPITRTLVHFSHSLSPKDLSSEVFQRTKYLLLDYLGVAIAGSLTESSQAVYRMLARAAPPGPCTVIGTAGNCRTNDHVQCGRNQNSGPRLSVVEEQRGDPLATWVKIQGTIPPVLLRPRSQDSSTEEFTMPRAEYERWQKGGRPLLAFQFRGADGKEMTETIRLIPMPAREGP